MKEKLSKHSKLRTAIDADDRPLESLLCEVDRNVRTMCRVMQVYHQNGSIHLKDMESENEELHDVLAVFYEFVDSQMEELSILTETLDRDFSFLTLNRLREVPDFMFDAAQGQPAPKENLRDEQMQCRIKQHISIE